MAIPSVEILFPTLPLTADEARLGLAGVALITAGQLRIVYDTGGPMIREGIITGLRRRGLTPADIDLVVLSHLHWDHAMNFDLFPSCPLACHPAEWEYAADPAPHDWATLRYMRQALHGREVRLVEDGTELAPGVAVVFAPGHSQGLIALRAETAAGPVVLASDAIPSADTLALGEPPLVFGDRAAARRSVARLARLGSVFYPGHDRPFRWEGGRANYLRRAEIHLRSAFSGTPPTTLHLQSPPTRG